MLKRIVLPAILVLFGAFIISSCGLNKVESVVKQYEDLQKKACACTDVACARSALEEFKNLSIKYKDLRANQDQLNRVTEASKNFTICIMKRGVTIKEIMDLQKALK